MAHDRSAIALAAAQHALFVVLLAIGAAQATEQARWTPWAAAAAVALAAWYVLGAVRGRRWSRPRGLAWLAGLTALWVVLLAGSPTFAWLVFPLALLTMHLVRGWAGIAAVAALTAAAILRLLPEASSPEGAVVGPVIGALVAIGVVRGFQDVLAESRERGRLLAELEAAQAELAVLQHEAGAAAERQRLARDIHDTLAQGYSSIVLLARAARARGTSEDDLLAQIEETASANLLQARGVVRALAPSELEGAPLPAAIRRLLDTLADQTGLDADLAVSGDPAGTPTAVEVAALRLVQGALANVRAHAEASRVVVSLTYDPAGELLVDVVDDGRGFDAAREPTVGPGGSGFGLRAMRERIAEIGGTLTVESAPGDGTAVAATIPFERGA